MRRAHGTDDRPHVLVLLAAPVASTAVLATGVLLTLLSYSPIDAVVFGVLVATHTAPLVLGAVAAALYVGLSHRQAWALVAMTVHLLLVAWIYLGTINGPDAVLSPAVVATIATTSTVLVATATVVGGTFLGHLIGRRVFSVTLPTG